MSKAFIMKSIMLIFPFFIITFHAIGQKGKFEKDHSDLSGIPLPGKVIQDTRMLSVAAAKTVLEMESGPYQIALSEVEVFSIPNLSGIMEDAERNAQNFFRSVEGSGYELFPSVNDATFTWMRGNNRVILMYLSSTKKETALYFGKADNLPPFKEKSGIVSISSSLPGQVDAMTVSKTVTGGSTMNPEEAGNPDLKNITGEVSRLTGNWGMISGSPINYIDDNNYNIVSGVSRGFGLELRGDGTYLQVSVVDSGRPSYRIHVSTTGTWSVNGNLLVFNPADRHYRKWEYEMLKTDEHSVPESYTMIWYLAKNEVAGKDCLYIKYEESQPKWEELCSE